MKTKVSFEGPEDADIYLVGEAPGEEENDQGRPFVGRAGRFLESYLNRVGFDRSEVRLGNLYGYQPPDNKFTWLRANKVEELEASIAELLEDIVPLLNHEEIAEIYSSVNPPILVNALSGASGNVIKKIFEKKRSLPASIFSKI